MIEKRSPDQLPGITTGNAVVDGRDFNHWFVGDLHQWSKGRVDVPGTSDFGLRDSRSVEIKWGIHPKGEERSNGWAPGSEKITLSILLRGRFLLRFRGLDDRSREWQHTLTQEGDYVIWDERVEHTWNAEEDSVILTLRWWEEAYKI